MKTVCSKSEVWSGQQVEWRQWSAGAFEDAKRLDKLLLLDLTATWCHWCHVMDETTYSDDEVIHLINENFVPVRVDIDQRPDISERYNRGGFPTTAILSERGESVWGATYVPPADMKRVIQGILKARLSGEIEGALGRARASSLAAVRPRPDRRLPSKDELDSAVEDMFDAYDVEHGGFGFEPKFPHPDIVDLLTTRNLSEKEPVLSDAVTHTLTSMAEGLYDEAEGGVFRYSVVRDWSVPHYEKMLETNLGYLRNLARVHVVFGDPRLDDVADGVAGYLLRTLRDPSTGAFFGSQDADEGYYALSAEARAKRAAPSVDRTVYSGWNALASSVLIEAGTLLDRPDLTDAGLVALDHITKRQWNPDRGLMRHSEGQELYLSEDQVEVLGALLAAMELHGTDRFEPMAMSLAEGVMKTFTSEAGGLGDTASDGGGIGDLARPIRSVVTNSRWAHRLSLLGIATGRIGLIDDARAVLSSFDMDTVRAHGLFAAPYVTACEALKAGLVKVEVHGSGNGAGTNVMWLASKRALDPRAIILFVGDGEDFAVVCSDAGCSSKIVDPRELLDELRTSTRTQV